MSSLKKQLVKLGSKRVHLRDPIRKVLKHLERTSSDRTRKKASGKLYYEIYGRSGKFLMLYSLYRGPLLPKEASRIAKSEVIPAAMDVAFQANDLDGSEILDSTSLEGRIYPYDPESVLIGCKMGVFTDQDKGLVLEVLDHMGITELK